MADPLEELFRAVLGAKIQGIPAEGLLYRAGDGDIDLALRVLNHLVALRAARGRHGTAGYASGAVAKVVKQPAEEEIKRGGQDEQEDYPFYFFASFIAWRNDATSWLSSMFSLWPGTAFISLSYSASASL